MLDNHEDEHRRKSEALDILTLIKQGGTNQ